MEVGGPKISDLTLGESPERRDQTREILQEKLGSGESYWPGQRMFPGSCAKSAEDPNDGSVRGKTKHGKPRGFITTRSSGTYREREEA